MKCECVCVCVCVCERERVRVCVSEYVCMERERERLIDFKDLAQVIVKSAASQVALVVKNPPANAGDMRHRFDP